MKLLQINSTANWGSTGRIAEQIGNVAISLGWDSYIAYGRYANKSNSRLIKIGNKVDSAWHLMCSRLFDCQGLCSRKATKRFVEQIEHIKPDLIHLHNIHGYYLNYEILFKYLRNTGIPVVWTLHDCWTFTGHCAHFSYNKCEKWKNECKECPLKGEYPSSLLLDRSRKNFLCKKGHFSSLENMAVVSVSKWLDSMVDASFLTDKQRHVIYNGINVEVFSPMTDIDELREKYNLQNKKVLIGVASVWDKYKGYDDYLRLHEMLPDNTQLIMVGLSEKQLNALPKGIIGLQRTQNVEALVKLYSLADIVLNLSYQETFGLTTVEGFACGTPGVVYNKTASPELIDESCGKIVEAGNMEQLLSAITEILSKGKSHYSHACRQRAVALYNKDDRYEDYIKLYESLIGSSH